MGIKTDGDGKQTDCSGEKKSYDRIFGPVKDDETAE